MVEARQVTGEELYESINKYIQSGRYQAIIITTEHSRRIIHLKRCNIISKVEFGGEILTFIRYIGDEMIDRLELNINVIKTVDGILFP